MKFLAVGAVFLGEVLVVYAEVLGAKLYSSGFHSFGSSFLYTLAPLIVGSVLLVTGYMFGLRYFQNIWIVTAISLGTLLIVEPLLNLFFIGQVPTVGATIGLLFGIMGILASLFL